MIVLGLIGFGESPAACVLRDGELLCMVEEERLSRLKSSHGMFPSRSVAWCLKSQGLELSDVDRLAFGWDAKQYPWKVARNYARTLWSNLGRLRRAGGGKAAPPYVTAAEYLLIWHPERIRNGIRDGLRAAGLRGGIPPVEFVDHHLAHAASTYYLSGFDRAGILTLDGSGERTTTQIALGEGDRIEVVDRWEIPDSLGWFYAAITQYLGFVPYRDEGKLMGLAALGERRAETNPWLEPLSRVLRIEGEHCRVDPLYTHLGAHDHGDRYTNALVDLITSIDPEARPIAYGERADFHGEQQSRYLMPRYVDIAWAAQELLERAAVMLARRTVRELRVDRICLAGGVAMNCKMNGEILRHTGVQEIFVQPASSDAGAAIGAALVVSAREGSTVRRRLSHVQYGPNFVDADIRDALEASKASYRELSDPAHGAAELIADGKLIAWFQGPMEFGARALGGRSILANPADPAMRDTINARVKYRESWRPFCPSMTARSATRYLVDPGEAEFMIVAYPATAECIAALPAVVHVDGTVRPQIVREEIHPLYHRLIEEVGKRTGHEVVLNTSFNVRGEPIVCTPLEAIRCFFSNGLDALVMGRYLVTK